MEPRPLAELVVLSGDDAGREIIVRVGQTFVLGRAGQVVLDDELVSRRHATVELTPHGVRVTDLGSKNGTMLGSQRLTPHEPTLAGDRDLLEIGGFLIRLKVRRGTVPDDEIDDETRTLRADLLPAKEFTLLGKLGGGATGTVYAAEQKLLRRKVAIKILHTPLAGPERRRFLSQGWICRRIRSPNVVEVHDARVLRGRILIIMDLVPGPSIQDRLQSGPIPLVDVLRVGEHVALALEAGRQAGVSHLDLKPSNILLDPKGSAKLVDFGLAHALGLPTTHSDTCALGRTLHHLLAGSPPPPPGGVPSTDPLPSCPAQLEELIHALQGATPPSTEQAAKILGELHATVLADGRLLGDSTVVDRPIPQRALDADRLGGKKPLP